MSYVRDLHAKRSQPTEGQTHDKAFAFMATACGNLQRRPAHGLCFARPPASNGWNSGYSGWNSGYNGSYASDPVPSQLRQ
ncbi:hypothetical protein FRZ44_44550 [Hypericibacter terrae]|jgi:hypothetical protein|uniref:Uncharacterized protein n=1 Tax=Hypericibacter terrae TaxID=2602015 RepID=A0A5J6MP52_9PROT|nr:hypothetical protein FRZ44_44550 [Hypericibacter terrae]